MPTPALSIVTPALDQLDYLRQCAANVARQGDSVEHIVVDGGSTDGSVDWLAAQQDRPGAPRYLSRRDRGMYEALNRGFALARGELLGYLNCDDLLLPWATSQIIEAFARWPRVELIYGDALEWYPALDRAALVVHPPAPLLGRFLRLGGHLAQPAVFFRRRLFERLGGFDPSWRLLGDHAFWLRALASGVSVRHLDEVLAIQRMVHGQLMQRHESLARQEKQRIQRLLGSPLPSPLSRPISHTAAAALHRQGLARLLAAPLPARLRGASWRRLLASGLLRPAGRATLLRALLASTRGRTYLRLDPAVLAQLTGAVLDGGSGRG